MKKSLLFTQLISPAAIFLVIIGIFLALGTVGYSVWMEYTGEMEVRRLEARAAALEAQASADRAAAELANANAVLAPAEAAALTVERQSAVMTYWGFLSPALLIFIVSAIALLGIAVGAAGTMWVTQKEKANATSD